MMTMKNIIDGTPLKGHLYNDKDNSLNNKYLNDFRRGLPSSRREAFNILNKFKWNFDNTLNFSHVEFAYTLRDRPPGNDLIIRIEQSYTEKDRLESANLFIVFSCKNKYKDVMTLLNDFIIPDRLAAHEVPCIIRRIAVDIDITENTDKHVEIKNTIIDAFTTVLIIMGHTHTSYAVASRHRDYKKSYHVVFNGVVADTYTQTEIYSRVQERLNLTPDGKLAAKAVDNIYTKRSLAITGAYKGGRQLNPDNNEGYQKFMINFTEAADIDISLPNPALKKTLTPVNNDIIVSMKADLLNNYEVLEQKNDIYPLQRINPFECIICNRIHEKNNQCYLTSSAEYGVIVRCWRQPPQTPGICILKPSKLKNVENNEKPPLAEKAHKRLQRYLYYQTAFPMFYDDNAFIPPQKTDTMDVQIYNDKDVKEYPATGDVFTRAIMGLGKTQAIKLTLNTAIMENKDLTILIISFRKSLGREFNKVFKEFDFVSYSDIKGDINIKNNPRVIVQVESIYRIMNKYDVVLFDEAESICDQLFSSTMKRGRLCYETLEMLLKHSGRVIIMDANLTWRPILYINQFRPDATSTFIHNERNRAEQFEDRGKSPPINHYTTSKALIQAKIITSLETGQKVVVAMTTATEGVRALYDALVEKFPLKNIKCYTCMTDIKVKEADFADTTTAWAGVDCLIYSPTLQAGVSYVENHFDTFYGIFSCASSNVGSARQMIHRVRNFKNSNYYICLTGRPNTKLWQTSEAEYASYLTTQSRKLQELPDGIDFKKAPTGRIYVNYSPLFDLYVKTKVRDAHDTTHFISEFLTQELNSGVKGYYMDAEVPDDTLKNNLYNIVGFKPLKCLTPEWKQLMVFITDNAERLKLLDESVKPILRQYGKIAEDMALVEMEAALRDENPLDKGLTEFSKTAFIRFKQADNKLTELNLLANTELIDIGQAEIITKKMEKEITLTPDEQAAIKIYFMNEQYHGQYEIKEPDANKSFIEHYDDPGIKAMYRNLRRLRGNYTAEAIAERCKQIEEDEKESSTEYLAKGKIGSITAHLLNLESLTYRKHQISHDLIKALGIKDITGGRDWTREELHISLKANNPYIKNNIHEIAPLFEKRVKDYNNDTSKPTFITSELKFINAILLSMLGITIKAKGKGRKDRDNFILNHEWKKHFKLNTGFDKNIISPLWVELQPSITE